MPCMDGVMDSAPQGLGADSLLDDAVCKPYLKGPAEHGFGCSRLWVSIHSIRTKQHSKDVIQSPVSEGLWKAVPRLHLAAVWVS